ncbi:MAG: acyl-CoA thioesterase [Luminiphilus sp.]|jgi:acyl-CoA thioester hydrolase|nr:acyl-CoA thioesterase [Luminiphilus sp.]
MTTHQWDYPRPFLLEITVEPHHIDALAHTRNTHYVEWCMETAWAHTSALGLGAEAYQQLDRAMALTHAEYDYLKATRAGDHLLIGTWITDWISRLKMTRRLQVICTTSGETVFRGALEFVCIEISTGLPKRPPRAFIDIYGPAITAAH